VSTNALTSSARSCRCARSVVVADDVRVMHRRAVLAALMVGTLGLVWGAAAVIDRRNDVDYTNLVAEAQRQATSDGDRVSPLPDGIAERWHDNGGPTWADAHKFSSPGNVRLAPVYDKLATVVKERGGESDFAYPNFECLYWPVVPHEGDRVTRTEYMLWRCYQSTEPAARPYAITNMAVHFD
jgi:hypothetical protein